MGAATGSRGVRSSLRNLSPHFPPLRLHSCTCSVCPRIGLAGGGHRLAPPLKGPVPSLLTPNRSSGNWPPSSLILITSPQNPVFTSCRLLLPPLWTQEFPPEVEGVLDGEESRMWARVHRGGGKLHSCEISASMGLSCARGPRRAWKANGQEGRKALKFCSRNARRGKGNESKLSFPQLRGCLCCRWG